MVEGARSIFSPRWLYGIEWHLYHWIIRTRENSLAPSQLKIRRLKRAHFQPQKCASFEWRGKKWIHFRIRKTGNAQHNNSLCRRSERGVRRSIYYSVSVEWAKTDGWWANRMNDSSINWQLPYYSNCRLFSLHTEVMESSSTDCERRIGLSKMSPLPRSKLSWRDKNHWWFCSIRGSMILQPLPSLFYFLLQTGKLSFIFAWRLRGRKIEFWRFWDIFESF